MLAEAELPWSHWLNALGASGPKDTPIGPATLLARIEKVSTSVREVRKLIWFLISFLIGVAIAFAFFR